MLHGGSFFTLSMFSVLFVTLWSQAIVPNEGYHVV